MPRRLLFITPNTFAKELLSSSLVDTAGGAVVISGKRVDIFVLPSVHHRLRQLPCREIVLLLPFRAD